MTGITLNGLINTVFADNYTELQKWARDEDLLHQVYVNVMERLERGAIQTGETITQAVTGIKNYFKKAIVN